MRNSAYARLFDRHMGKLEYSNHQVHRPEGSSAEWIGCLLGDKYLLHADAVAGANGEGVEAIFAVAGEGGVGEPALGEKFLGAGEVGGAEVGGALGDG
jgi:hypothetical protein